MRRVILFRHAKTEAQSVGGRDFDRALTERGRLDAALVARRLAEVGFTPDRVLVSPALRARQTWTCVAGTFPGAQMDIRDGLYNAAPEDVAAAMGTAGSASLMIIGHNPSLQELAIEMLAEGRGTPGDIEQLTVSFPTATAVVLAVDAEGRAALDGLIHARDLRA